MQQQNKKIGHIVAEFHKLQKENEAEDKKLLKILQNSKYQKIKPNEHESIGDKVADKVAKFGGSWSFIISFIVVLVAWTTLNVLRVFNFDPYPFILLNLFLSCIAAVQAPIIMMSQNRQAKRDKIDQLNDARINKQSNAKLNLLMRRSENLHHEITSLFTLLQLDLEERSKQGDDSSD